MCSNYLRLKFKIILIKIIKIVRFECSGGYFGRCGSSEEQGSGPFVKYVEQSRIVL